MTYDAIDTDLHEVIWPQGIVALSAPASGDCFVFDYRTALSPALEETAVTQCYGCRAVVTPREQLSPYYVAGKSCPHCKKAMRAETSPA